MSVAEPDRADLKICVPHQPVRFISARLSGPIHALQALWHTNPKRFIFNGIELREDRSFEFYGIRDGDSIVALPLENRASVYAANPWLNLTRDADTFNESIRWMVDPATAAESARLRDLQLMRIERRPIAFIRLYAPARLEENCQVRPSSSTVLGLPPKSPSVDALPLALE
jgi:hypothetical protein